MFPPIPVFVYLRNLYLNPHFATFLNTFQLWSLGKNQIDVNYNRKLCFLLLDIASDLIYSNIMLVYFYTVKYCMYSEYSDFMLNLYGSDSPH